MRVVKSGGHPESLPFLVLGPLAKIQSHLVKVGPGHQCRFLCSISSYHWEQYDTSEIYLLFDLDGDDQPLDSVVCLI
jgi:hypothetical protein